MTSTPTFGPWAPTLDPAERLARCRSLRALVRVLAGPRGRELAAALRQAEADPAALDLAAHLLDRLPTVPRRHILAAYVALDRESRL
ncbi:MAG: hypothetical protein M0006_10185 [Magnetospirillum sp.]|nr:hypothetical protein [Magnetospirillum sp.]